MLPGTDTKSLPSLVLSRQPLSRDVWSPHITYYGVFGCRASPDLQWWKAFSCGLQGAKALLADGDCLSPRPEAANEFYDGDHDNDKESDVEI